MSRYWEAETPKVMRTGKNEIRFFKEHGKIQVYPRVDSAPRGVGKGATIDLAGMSVDELREFKAQVDAALEAQMEIV